MPAAWFTGAELVGMQKLLHSPVAQMHYCSHYSVNAYQLLPRKCQQTMAACTLVRHVAPVVLSVLPTKWCC
jgi:hypothetical protein